MKGRSNLEHPSRCISAFCKTLATGEPCKCWGGGEIRGISCFCTTYQIEEEDWQKNFSIEKDNGRVSRGILHQILSMYGSPSASGSFALLAFE